MTVSTEIEDLTDSEDLIWTLREKYKGWYLIVSDSSISYDIFFFQDFFFKKAS